MPPTRDDARCQRRDDGTNLDNEHRSLPRQLQNEDAQRPRHRRPAEQPEDGSQHDPQFQRSLDGQFEYRPTFAPPAWTTASTKVAQLCGTMPQSHLRAVSCSSLR